MSARAPQRAARLDAALVALAALAARLGWAAYARGVFPPAGDGVYYDTLARRIAHGDGYTWAWPDGAVTFVAHYPVGYPALLAAAYAALGASATVAALVNALVGALAAVGARALLASATTRGRAYAGAVVVAVHPALVPYTSAVMTEGIAASLLVVAGALASRARRAEGDAAGAAWRWIAAAGLALGIATLVRPQCVLLAPALGALAPRAGSGARARALGAAAVTAVALLACAPWTARNCARMHRCALVSVNGGWNLLIGAQTQSGAWSELAVPPECATVWDEAAKDACFARAARARIARDPVGWLARAPRKLAVTFDAFAAAPWYLHASNARAFTEEDKFALGAVETVFSRLALLGALGACAALRGPRRRARVLLALAASACALTEHAWPAYLALPALVALLGARRVASAPLAVTWTAAVIAATAVTHAIFFGAGRYGLAVAPLVAALAFAREPPPNDRLAR